jgi:hypothetical protein
MNGFCVQCRFLESPCLYLSLFALSLMQQGDRSSAGLVLGCYTWELLGFQAWDK